MAAAPSVHYSFVVDAPGQFGYQALVLTRSLIEFGRVAPSAISAHVVEGTDGEVAQQLRNVGATVRGVKPFGHPYCNRLQQLEHLVSVDADYLVLLDTDVFCVRPLEIPTGTGVWGKVVDAPNPPIDVVRRIFEAAALPVEEVETDVVKAPTVRANFNAGLYIVSTAVLAPLADAWRRWARWSLARIALFEKWHANVDQLSFALAAAELRLATHSLRREFNTPTHLGPVHVRDTPFLLHYHRHVDDDLLLRTCGEPTVDHAVELANSAARRWRAEGLADRLVTNARRAIAPTQLHASGPSARPANEARRGTVAIVVPAYRPGPRYIGLLESIAAQSYPDVIVRVSVDHAPDHQTPTPPDMRGKRLEVTHQQARRGWAGNTNAALESVREPYFITLMHDDQLTPDYVERALEALEREPAAVVAHGAVRHHGIRDGEVHSTESIPGDRVERIMTFIARGPHIAGLGWRGLVRSELLKHGLRLRTRRSDGQFSNDLMSLEMLVHGASLFVPGIYYDKYTDPGGLSRAFHRRTYQERSAMLADNLACLIDVLAEAGFGEADKIEIASRYAEWLLGLQGNWNVVSEATSSDSQAYGEVRPALARFVAHTALSLVAQPDESAPVRSASAAPTSPRGGVASPSRVGGVVPRARQLRSRLAMAWTRLLVRLPHPLRRNPLFDARWYRAHHPDVRAGRTSAYGHYRRHGLAEGTDPNEFFDTDWYLARYPDVRASRMDPLDHYFLFGAREGRDPGPTFDTAWYLDVNRDVAQSGMNPLLHFLRHGRAENRLPRKEGQRHTAPGATA